MKLNGNVIDSIAGKLPLLSKNEKGAIRSLSSRQFIFLMMTLLEKITLLRLTYIPK